METKSVSLVLCVGKVKTSQKNQIPTTKEWDVIISNTIQSLVKNSYLPAAVEYRHILSAAFMNSESKVEWPTCLCAVIDLNNVQALPATFIVHDQICDVEPGVFALTLIAKMCEGIRSMSRYELILFTRTIDLSKPTYIDNESAFQIITSNHSLTERMSKTIDGVKSNKIKIKTLLLPSTI